MKTIGLLGGMSWESTVGYYRALNEGVKNRLGKLHSARIVMVSVDFEPLEQLQHAGDWDSIAALLCEDARKVEQAGADFLVIGSNTMHRIAPQIEAAVELPLLHIADATAQVIRDQGVDTVGLLGTAFTMEQDFYKGRLEKEHGIKVITPVKSDRDLVHRVIYTELCLGQFTAGSRQEFLRISEGLAADGAGAVILGCTEIGMLISQADTDVTLIDTCAVHADAIVEYALNA